MYFSCSQFVNLILFLVFHPWGKKFMEFIRVKIVLHFQTYKLKKLINEMEKEVKIKLKFLENILLVENNV